MGTYRGDPTPTEKQPPTTPTPAHKPTVADNELIALNRHRQRQGHEPASYYQPDDADVSLVEPDPVQPEPVASDLAVNSGGIGTATKSKTTQKMAGNLVKKMAGKKILLAGSGAVAPFGILMIVLIMAMSAGFQIEHINQVITGYRFSRVHNEIRKRGRHLETRAAYIDNKNIADSNDLETKLNNDANERDTKKAIKRTLAREKAMGRGSPLLLRLLNLDDGKVHRYLTQNKNLEINYRNRASLFGTKLRIDTIVDKRNGSVVFDAADRNKNSIGIIRNLTKPEGADSLNRRLLARRSTRLLASQIGFRLFRFRNTLDKIRERRLNSGRAPPPSEVRADVSKDILEDKARIRDRVNPRLRIKALGFNLDKAEIEEYGQNRLVQRLDFDKSKVPGISQMTKLSTGVGSKASIVVLLTTVFCTLYQVVEMIRDLARTRIYGQADAAANMITTTSQIRAGDMETEVINDYNRRLDGFSGAPTYQLATLGAQAYLAQHEESQVRQFVVDARDRYGVGALFSGFFGIAQGVLNYTLPIARAIINQFMPGLGVGQFCRFALNMWVQIMAGLLEIGVITLATVGTGGGALIAWTSLKLLLQAIIFDLGSRFVLGVVAANSNIDEVLQEALVPAAVEIASGAESGLSDAPGAGPANYSLLDYGAHNLSEGLAPGGRPMDVGPATTATLAAIDRNRQNYSQKGVINNIFDQNNPYSLVAGLFGRTPSTPTAINQTRLATATKGLARLSPLSAPATATATSDQTILSELLYPGQTHVIGFAPEEIEGSGDFEFITNSDFVERHLDKLKNRYSDCLSIDPADFLMDQAGIKPLVDGGGLFGEESQWGAVDGGSKFYPDKCTDLNARRYMIYYQDCSQVQALSLEGSNLSPMAPNECDELLDDDFIRALNETETESPGGFSGGGVCSVVGGIFNSAVDWLGTLMGLFNPLFALGRKLISIFWDPSQESTGALFEKACLQVAGGNQSSDVVEIAETLKEAERSSGDSNYIEQNEQIATELNACAANQAVCQVSDDDYDNLIPTD